MSCLIDAVGEKWRWTWPVLHRPLLLLLGWSEVRWSITETPWFDISFLRCCVSHRLRGRRCHQRSDSRSRCYSSKRTFSFMVKNRWSVLFRSQTSKWEKIRATPRYHRFIPPEYCSIMFKVTASRVEPDSTSAAGHCGRPQTHMLPPPRGGIQLVKAHWRVQTPKGRRITSALTGSDLEAVAGPDVDRLRGACDVRGAQYHICTRWAEGHVRGSYRRTGDFPLMCILADATSLCRNFGDSGLYFTRLRRISPRRAGKLRQSLAEPVA